jgi:hypothetical protein
MRSALNSGLPGAGFGVGHHVVDIVGVFSLVEELLSDRAASDSNLDGAVNERGKLQRPAGVLWAAGSSLEQIRMGIYPPMQRLVTLSICSGCSVGVNRRVG